MYKTTTYVCDGAIYCGFKPKGVKAKEERTILHPEKGFKLKRKSDDKILNAVWLKENDSEENYVEVESDDNSK